MISTTHKEILKEHFEWKMLIRLIFAVAWCYFIYRETGIFTAGFAFLIALYVELQGIADKMHQSTIKLHNEIFLLLMEKLGLKKDELK